MSYSYVKGTLKRIHDEHGVDNEIKIMKEIIEYLDAVVNGEDREFSLSPEADGIAQKIEDQIDQLVAETYLTHLGRIKARLSTRNLANT